MRKPVIPCPRGEGGFPRVSDAKSFFSEEKTKGEEEEARGPYGLKQVGSVVDQIDAHAQTVADVAQIRKVLLNASDKPDKDLLASLQWLKSMGLSAQILKETEIENLVYNLQEHRLMHTCALSRNLITDWKNTKAEWQDSILHSMSTSVSGIEEKGGLPVPPLDKWAFLTPLPSSMSFSEFFEGIDDIGAEDIQGSDMLNISTEPQPHLQPKLNENKMNRLKGVDGLNKGRPKELLQPQLKRARDEIKMTKEIDRVDRSLKPQQQRQPLQKRNGKEVKTLEAVMKSKIHCAAPMRKGHKKQHEHCKLTEENKRTKQVNKSDDCKLVGCQVDASSTKASLQLKLETTKRKLHESYSRIENAKKKQKVQLLDLKDLPKPEIVHGNRRQHRGPMSKKFRPSVAIH